MWDDIDVSRDKTFDLADFSAATLKFSESAIKITDGELYSKEGDDTMEKLFEEEREKKQASNKSGTEKRNLLLQVS